MRLRYWFGAGLAALVACSDSTTAVGPEGTGTGSGAGMSTGAVPPAPALVPADGVTITRISLYQGVERPLVINGAPQSSDVPIVPGRPALLRVFYEAPEAAGGAVTARLELGDGEPIDVDVDLDAASIDGNLETTANFFLDGADIQDTLSYRVSFLEEAVNAGGGATDGAVFPAEGRDEHAVDGSVQKLRVVLVPFQYNADGSGRTPDISPEAIERYRERFLGMFPVSDVEVTVRDPLPYSSQISPFGGGWQNALEQIGFLRQQETPSQDVYYYGAFNPTESLGQFCGGGGCILGLAPLNEPENSDFRFGIGVGFNEVIADTSVHEIGHAHGRNHVNCGPGVQGIDQNYPHAGTTIGVWGYDIVNQQLKDPSVYSDIMGYCDDQWVSDYQFINFFNRGRTVNQPLVDGDVRQPFTVIAVDEVGGTREVGEWDLGPSLGRSADVTVRTASGEEERGARFVRFDHLPGGWLIVPGSTDEVMGVDGLVDGHEIRWDR